MRTPREKISRVETVNLHGPTLARQRFGVRWVRGEGTHRFGSGDPQTIQSGVSPVPRQPPHSKISRRSGRFMESPLSRLRMHWDHERVRFMERIRFMVW